MEILIDLLITAFGYMIYPLAKYKIIDKNVKHDNKSIKKTLIINSITVAIVFLIIKYNMYGDALKINFMPAIIYYCINLGIYSEKEKNTKSINSSKQQKEKKDNKKYEIEIFGIKIDDNSSLIPIAIIGIGLILILLIYANWQIKKLPGATGSSEHKPYKKITL